DMAFELGRRLVRRVERGARQLELSARLERNGGALLVVVEADQMAGVLDPLPTESGVHPLEQRADAPFAHVRDGRQIGAVKEDLFVLRPDSKGAGALAPCFEPGGERVARFDDLPVDDVASHKAWRPCGRRAAGGWRLDSWAGATMQIRGLRCGRRLGERLGDRAEARLLCLRRLYAGDEH